MIDDDSLELGPLHFSNSFYHGGSSLIVSTFFIKFHRLTHSALLSQGPTVLHSTDVLIQAGLVVTALGRPETDEALQLILASWRLDANLAHGRAQEKDRCRKKWMDTPMISNDVCLCIYIYIYYIIYIYIYHDIYQPWFTWPVNWDEPPRLPITTDPSSLGTVFPDADLS